MATDAETLVGTKADRKKSALKLIAEQESFRGNASGSQLDARMAKLLRVLVREFL